MNRLNVDDGAINDELLTRMTNTNVNLFNGGFYNSTNLKLTPGKSTVITRTSSKLQHLSTIVHVYSTAKLVWVKITSLCLVSLQTLILDGAVHLPPCSKAKVFGFIGLLQHTFLFHCSYM